jgi:hypothetical protein
MPNLASMVVSSSDQTSRFPDIVDIPFSTTCNGLVACTDVLALISGSSGKFGDRVGTSTLTLRHTGIRHCVEVAPQFAHPRRDIIAGDDVFGKDRSIG